LLEGENQIDAFGISRLEQGRHDVLNRRKINRAFSSYQMLTLLLEMTSTRVMQTVNQEEQFIRSRVLIGIEPLLARFQA